MKKSSLLLGVVLLSSCTIERVVEKPVEEVTTTVAKTYAPDPELTLSEKEDLVIAFVIENYGSMPNTRSEILETAHLVCRNLRSGAVTVDELGSMIQEASDTADSVTYLAAITAGAIGFLCPEYMPDEV